MRFPPVSFFSTKRINVHRQQFHFDILLLDQRSKTSILPMNLPFEPRTLVNGGMLQQFVGQTVSIMARVESVAGTTLLANSSDNHKLRVSLPSELNAAEGTWVEIIGVPSGNDGMRVKEVIEFGGEKIDFDSDSYNVMTQLLNNVKLFY